MMIYARRSMKPSAFYQCRGCWKSWDLARTRRRRRVVRFRITRTSPGLIHQTAHDINLVLAQRGVIKIVRVGDARPNGKASEFQCLLSQSENPAQEDDAGIEI